MTDVATGAPSDGDGSQSSATTAPEGLSSSVGNPNTAADTTPMMIDNPTTTTSATTDTTAAAVVPAPILALRQRALALKLQLFDQSKSMCLAKKSELFYL